MHSDFLPEFEDDLRSQIEQTESTLGRKLNDAEVAEILKKRGHPVLAATRLMPQQHLIGPAWFPVYRFALKAVIIWILAPLFLVLLPSLAAISSSAPLKAFIDTVFKYPGAAIHAAIIITLIVAGLERLELKIKLFENWNPADLPEAPPAENLERISRCASMSDMALGGIFIVAWTGLIKNPVPLPIELVQSMSWDSYFWPILLLVAASVAFATVKLLRPYWRPSYSVFNIALQGATLILLWLIVGNGMTVALSSDLMSSEKLLKIQKIVDWSLLITYVSLASYSAVNIYLDLRRLWLVKKMRPRVIQPVWV